MVKKMVRILIYPLLVGLIFTPFSLVSASSPVVGAVLFFSPTEHNMHIQQSVMLINTLEPDYILPQHRDTYWQTPENRYWTNAYAQEVKTHLSRSLQKNYYVLNQGECLIVK